ncbi:MAG: SDR family oxidoreductase [Salinibacter sp.]
MAPTISILGCGWLGQPLGARLAARGVTVRGSTTTPEKQEALRRDGIDPVVLRLDPEMSGDPGALFASPVLVLNIPPPRGAETVAARHRRQIESVLDAAADGGVEWILFASSTGVYPNVERTVTEADLPPGQPEALPGPRRRTGAALLDVEGLLMNAPDIDTTIVRLGGLYGSDRHPGRFLAGRSNVGRPHAPVNLIHQADAVGIFSTLLAQDVRGEVFNACADEHPTRQSLYTQAAQHLGLEPPTFDLDDATRGKIVSNQRVKDRCGYTFQHPDPLADLPAPTDDD